VKSKEVMDAKSCGMLTMVETQAYNLRYAISAIRDNGPQLSDKVDKLLNDAELKIISAENEISRTPAVG
jgi:hypothetical protein